jgi:hypothetical protein
VTRAVGRPAGHPLVELVYDLRTSIGEDEPGSDGRGGRPGVYDAVRGTLHAARRLVDALELLVAELEARDADASAGPPVDQEADDADFQRIHVR